MPRGLFMGSTLASGLFFLEQEYTTQRKKMIDPLMESIDSVGNVPVRVVVIRLQNYGKNLLTGMLCGEVEVVGNEERQE